MLRNITGLHTGTGMSNMRIVIISKIEYVKQSGGIKKAGSKNEPANIISKIVPTYYHEK